jgi:hypothetical protein
MAKKRNFLLGKGERLTEPVIPAGRKLDKVAPYSYEEARTRLVPMFEDALTQMVDLPDAARPAGQVVGALIMNPEYIAKSYYPEHVLKNYGLRAVGSKPARITPEKRSQNREPVEKPSTQLFVAGPLSSFRRLLADLEASSVSESVQSELPSLERFQAVDPEEKIKGVPDGAENIPLEVVLHATEFRSDLFIIDAFQRYLRSLGLQADLDHRLHAGGLCFLRMRAPEDLIPEIAKFSFLRAVREMPRLRELAPLRSLAPAQSDIVLPSAPAMDTNIRVAIFDGGFPNSSPLDPWVNRFDPPGIGAPVASAVAHGYAVTSAALFGHLTPGKMAPQPFAAVDHIRIWDTNSGNDPLELFDVLERIKNTLDSSPKYDFINLSVGPNLPIDDDDVHAWTAVLDEYLADGSCLATIAVGNDGDADPTNGLNRVQVPSDTVNGLSIGACDSYSTPWKRAEYSSIGPGRSPGIVKPDLVAFGGTDDEPYYVLGPGKRLKPLPQSGTSFAAPHALRIGVGVKANFGASLDPLAIRALLIHTSEPGNETQAEIGWGKVRSDLDDIVVCPDGSFRVVYQGELTASKYLRAEIPLPDEELRGTVKITATCCFATEIDSAHPGGYTRSGLDIAFRPHASNFAPEATHPKTATFFSQSRLYQTEELLRADAHKWETCLHGIVKKQGRSLERPVFDIHYIARDEGRPEHHSTKIKYALVITVEAPRHPDLYDRIVRKYRNVLEPMTPIQVPIQIR